MHLCLIIVVATIYIVGLTKSSDSKSGREGESVAPTIKHLRVSDVNIPIWNKYS